MIVIPEHPEPGEEGRAAPARRRTRRGAGRSLQEPQQLREIFRPPRRRPMRRRVWANQFDNVANRQAHIETHGARDLGTDRRQGRWLRLPRSAPAARSPASRWASRRSNPNVKIALADPMGAALYSYYKHGELKSEGSSITEGIGQGRITANLEGAIVDDAFQIPDAEAIPIVFDLLQHEGLCMGGSTGVNVAGAIRLAKQTGPRPHHRDHPLRLRHALCLEALQPRLPAREGPARPRLARKGAGRAGCDGRRCPHDRPALPRRRLPERLRGHRRRRSTTAAASCSTARSSMQPPAASRATRARSSGTAARPLIATTVYDEAKNVVHVPAEGQPAPPAGIDGRSRARLGQPLPQHARPHADASALRVRALPRHRRRHRRRWRPHRLRHSRRPDPRQGRTDGARSTASSPRIIPSPSAGSPTRRWQRTST